MFGVCEAMNETEICEFLQARAGEHQRTAKCYNGSGSWRMARFQPRS